jgi:hypothetical protein
LTVTFGFFVDLMLVIALGSLLLGTFFLIRRMLSFFYKKKDSLTQKHVE